MKRLAFRTLFLLVFFSTDFLAQYSRDAINTTEDVIGAGPTEDDLITVDTDAVIDALSKEYGVERSRLTPQGVGPLVPVLTDSEEFGRSKNRRMELG